MTEGTKPPCTNLTPPGFTGHWREWHRGHGCDRDDGQPRSADAQAEVARHEVRADTGYLTDAELSCLRARTSGDALLVRALDELRARRAAASVDTRDPSDAPDGDKLLDRVHTLFLANPTRRFSPAEVRRRLGVGEAHVDVVAKALRRLVDDGHIRREGYANYRLRREILGARGPRSTAEEGHVP